MPTKLELTSENFDLFFARESEQISPEGMESLPGGISLKLFRGGGEFDASSLTRLSFFEKLFVLCKARNKRWWLVVEDDENGVTPDQFFEMQKKKKKRDYSSGNSSEFLSSCGEFFLANKELSDVFWYLNQLSHSHSYNYLMKGKNVKLPKNKVAEIGEQIRAVVKILMDYDRNKKIWVEAFNISIPEWYVLLYFYLYEGKETSASPIYREVFKRAYQSSPTKLRRCLSVLQTKGYIYKTGVIKGAKMGISVSGVNLVNTILKKYVLDV